MWHPSDSPHTTLLAFLEKFGTRNLKAAQYGDWVLALGLDFDECLNPHPRRSPDSIPIEL